jgi:hypothetical protein
MLGGLVSSGLVGPVRSRARRASLVLTNKNASNAVSLPYVLNVESGNANFAGSLSVGGIAYATTYSFINQNLVISSVAAPYTMLFYVGGGVGCQMSVTGTTLCVGSGGSIGFASGGLGATTTTGDTLLFRDAAGILAQRNGVNAQTFRVYNTYTSATSFENLQFKSVAAAAYQIGSAIGSAGGTNRAVEIGHYDSAGTFASALSVATTGIVSHTTTAASDIQAIRLYSGTVEYGAIRAETRFGAVQGWIGGKLGSQGGAGLHWDQTANSVSLHYIQGNTNLTISPSTLTYTSSNTTIFTITNKTAALTFAASTSGSPTLLTLTAPAHTTLTASTEATDVNFNLARTVQFATGALTTQRAMQIQAPTYAFVAASTITTASTLSISGPPVAGTNATITNPYALNVESGNANFAGDVTIPSPSVAASLTLSSTANSSTSGLYWSAKNMGGSVSTASMVINGGTGTVAFTYPSALLTFESNAGTAQISSTGTLYIKGSAASLEGGGTRIELAGAFRVRTGTVSLGEMSGSTNWSFQNLLLNGSVFAYNTYTSATSYERLNIRGKASANFEIGPENGSAGGTLRGLTIGGYALGSATITGWLQFRPNATTAALEAFYLGPIADSTAVGGNARGANAVDLQTSRTAAAQVASGANSFVAGIGNTASGTSSFVVGKNNVASGDEGSIAMGQGCTAAGYTQIAIGYNCTANSAYSNGTIAMGFNTSASCGSEQSAAIALGSYNSATTNATFAIGTYATATRYGMFARAAGRFAALGDAQFVQLVMRIKTTDATATTLMLDGATTRLTITSGKIMFCDILISGIKSDGSASSCYKRKVAIKNVAGTTALVGSVETIGTDIEDNAATDVAITADDTNDALQINVTGIAAETWRWVAVVEGLEIAYGT